MRKLTLPILALAAAFATPAFAESSHGIEQTNNDTRPALGVGAVGGTVVGVGVYNGWWGATAAGAALPTTAAGAAAVGGVAGVGAVALIDAAVQPCRGFHALLGMNHDECVNGVYVGPHRMSELHRHGRYVR
jgi:hypothetical protein